MSAEPQSQSERFFAEEMTIRHFVTQGSARWVAMGSLVVGSLFALAVAVGGRSDTQGSLESTVLTVGTITITPVDSFNTERVYTGVVKASQTSELGFERTGKLIAINVKEGDRVETDQVLARLDIRNLEAKQREFEAERAAAAALFAEMESGPRTETIEVARARVQQSGAELALQKADLARVSELARKRAVTQAELDTSQYGTQAAEARLAAAKQQLAELEAGTRQEKIDAQEAVVAQLDAALMNVAIEMEDGTLVAPFRGIVAKRYTDEGAIISPGKPLLRLVEQEQLEAWIGLPASTAARFEPGQQHDVIVGGKIYGATVMALLPELDLATRTRSVLFKFDGEAAHRIIPSQMARIEVTEPTSASGFWVPTTALLRGNRGLWSVYVVERNQLEGDAVVARRDVEVLHTESDRVFVRGTIGSGDRVIATGIHRVVPGQVVQTRPMPPNELVSNDNTPTPW